MTFTILGAPRTKKNHARIVRRRDGTPFILQAKSHDAWAKAAILQLQSQARGRTFSEVDQTPRNLRALVYRDRRVGDLGNYLAAICDVLETAGIVEDDKLIAGFDGSRLLVDRTNPRVELTLSPMGDAIGSD